MRYSYFISIPSLILFLFNMPEAASAAVECDDAEEAVTYWRCPQNAKLQLQLTNALKVKDRLAGIVADRVELTPGADVDDANAAYRDIVAKINTLCERIEQYRKDSINRD